ncbi:unnamed protein product, partial [Amoebophrya sp. A25]|eukprot:GSA25T00002348001.1
MRMAAVNQGGKSPFSMASQPVRCPYARSCPEVRWGVNEFSSSFAISRPGSASLYVEHPQIFDWGGIELATSYEAQISVCVPHDVPGLPAAYTRC